MQKVSQNVLKTARGREIALNAKKAFRFNEVHPTLELLWEQKALIFNHYTAMFFVRNTQLSCIANILSLKKSGTHLTTLIL